MEVFYLKKKQCGEQGVLKCHENCLSHTVAVNREQNLPQWRSNSHDECVVGLYDSQGPNFVSEPSSKVEFTNTSGGRIDCSAKGNPMPNVEWLGGDKLAVSTIPGIRLVRSNGSIIFPPFDAEAFRQDVHWAVYRCVASNSVGSIVSRDITVRAAVGLNTTSALANYATEVGMS
uniref:Ig-like domain-containing protein n=1 Tax=Timema monikensis TaxID=170555 RepID=A0A7R9DWZ7_9NEOP|nr:unnamed protein product [Timema monikensis]